MTLAGQIRWALPGALVSSVVALGALGAGASCASAENTMSIQPDGKIVVVGAAPQEGTPGTLVPAIVRFNSDGSIDRGFGRGGGLVDFRGEAAKPFTAVATTSRGVYAVQGGLGSYRVLRFENDGDADGDFGVEGVSKITQLNRSFATRPQWVEALGDGSLLVGGDAARPFGSSQFEGDVYAHRLHPDGSLSEVVGNFALTTEDDLGAPSAQGFAAAENGSVMVTGGLSPLSGAINGYVVRLREGSYDTAFGGGIDSPLSIFGPDSYTTGNAITVDAAGRTIVAHGLADRPSLSRLESDGTLDKTFGNSGVAVAPIETGGAAASAVATQPNSNILLAGAKSGSCRSYPSTGDGCWRIFVARFGADGQIDTSFGKAGLTEIAWIGSDESRPATIGIVSLANGGALVAATPTSSEESSFFVARLDPSGALDPNFGQGGVTSYTPCQGSVPERRRAGCLSNARVNLRASGLAKGAPRAKLKVDTDNLLDPMTEVRVVLPSALRAIPRRRNRVTAAAVPSGRRPRKVEPTRITIRLPQGARGLSVGLPSGLMKWVGLVKPGHKLVFRVDVTFKDGSSQRIPVRVAP